MSRTAGPLDARRLTLVVAGLLGAGLLGAPTAGAAPDDRLEQAVATLRAAGSCGPLRPDPVVQQVAEIASRSTEDYINHTARHVPVGDPLAVLTDLGGQAGSAIQLQGYGHDDVAAVKGALLQGHAVIPDCAYDTVGTSVIRNPDGGYSVAVVVLTGP